MFSSIINLSETAVLIIYTIGIIIGMVFRDYYCKGISFERTKSKRFSFISLLIFYTVVIPLDNLLLYFDNSNVSSFIYELIVFLVAVIILLKIYRTSFLEICAHMVCTQLFCNIFTFIFAFFQAKITNTTLGEAYMYIPNNLIALIILLIGSILSFLPGALIYNTKAFQKVKKVVGILYIVGFTANAVLVSISNTNETKSSSVLFVWMLILAAAAAAAILKTSFDNKSLNSQMEMQSSYYEKYASNQEIIRRMNHDIKNHMHTIAYMLKDSDNEEAVNYAKELEKEYSMIRTSFSENKILDAVFTLKYSEALKNGIDSEFVSNINGELKISNKDISAILSNLLDNAIEACKRNKTAENRITASVSNKKDNLIIKVTNTFDPAEENKKSKFFFTSKDDKFSHGLGIRIIKAVVSKYKGSMKTTADNGLYTVIVIV